MPTVETMTVEMLIERLRVCAATSVPPGTEAEELMVMASDRIQDDLTLELARASALSATQDELKTVLNSWAVLQADLGLMRHRAEVADLAHLPSGGDFLIARGGPAGRSIT